MGKYQLYSEEFLKCKNIWEHMKINFIYFLNVCRLDAAYSNYCEFELSNEIPEIITKSNLIKKNNENYIEECLLCKDNAILSCCEQKLYCLNCAKKISNQLGNVICWICKKVLFK